MITVSAGHFAQFVKKLGAAAGRASMNLDYSNILLREKCGRLELATTNGQMLALATIEGKDVPHGFSAIVSYPELLAASKRHEDDAFLEISSSDGKTLLLRSQSTQMLIPLVSEKFPEYEEIIENTKIVASGKICRSHLRDVCKMLDSSDRISTNIRFDPENGVVRLSTKGLERPIEVSVPVSCCIGSAIEVCMSRHNLSLAAKNCTGTEMEIAFSGETSLVSAIVDANLKYYFQPFSLE